MILRTMLTTLSAFALAACAVGPDFVAPPSPVTASGPFLSTRAGVTSTAPADANWWRLYNDPVLDTLIADALAANTDVRVAAARIAKARASLREVRGDRLPSTNLGSRRHLWPRQRRRGAPGRRPRGVAGRCRADRRI